MKKKRELKAFSYAQAGVDRSLRALAKNFRILAQTFSRKPLATPFNTLYPLDSKNYFVLTADGVGTKVLVAQLAREHSTIGVDGVAMVVNDCVRSGARPLALVDAIDVHHSEQNLLKELMKGIARGAREAGCAVVGGETADVPELVKGIDENPYHANFVCFGVVEKNKIVSGKNIKPGDVVIGLRSSGLHSNGFSLARRVLFKKWGGFYDANARPRGFNKPLVREVLTPTRIYVKPVLAAVREFRVKAAVHVTGDAFLKFGKLCNASRVGFVFNNFKPQPIFALIQETAARLGKKITDKEMFSTFNMGWGFALVVPRAEARPLARFLRARGEHAEEIGVATRAREIVAEFNGRKIVLA